LAIHASVAQALRPENVAQPLEPEIV